MPKSYYRGKVYELNCPECLKNSIIKYRAECFGLFHKFDSTNGQLTKGSKSND